MIQEMFLKINWGYEKFANWTAIMIGCGGAAMSYDYTEACKTFISEGKNTFIELPLKLTL